MTDSLKIYETLKSALPEAHASVIAKAIGTALDDNELHWANDLVPKVDAVKFDAEMHQMETSLDQRFAALEAKMESRFESLTVKLMAELSKLESRLESKIETQIANVKAEMIRWMFVFWVGQVAAMVAMIKLLK